MGTVDILCIVYSNLNTKYICKDLLSYGKFVDEK